MWYPKLAASLLLSLLATNAFAASDDAVEEEVPSPDASANLAVSVSASFPNSEIFGVKLVNGHPTNALLDFKNEEKEPVTIEFIGGSLLNPATGQPVRNLTVSKYNVHIGASSSASLTYSFQTEMHPQDLKLNLAAVVRDSKDAFYTLQAYNETVSIVEAPTSIFDPQILFLYFVLASVFAGTCYFIYNTWITTLFPQKKGRGKGGERAKTSSQGSKAVDPADQVAVVGADGPAVTSGAKTYDESWIPAGHLNRPEPRRVKSGTPKTKARG
ncbi:Translocon-associated protein (TRAP) alpha subunit [Lasiodiplodia theobromae]|uniref:Increased recombination centers protein 22 n=1 Tax=Lasiodiplodia theobromae TaxID=45133 RepID=A0A5N5DH83_9PEZI|nr:Translocon-associated protein (TRAP) alpha subunit [Lasiodiplodia theobromae]KAB2576402.1 Increased recombination centers protein 22 [Lasiodiplodia theobromae]KAF4543942.1 Translocon-associated protein (TRAP) alpha subunit [Lasiodiplodia theobromae]KAF9629283.1 Translocon-associated protein (TRAP) alpha subunit [Lasiodiplodia theobromae]